MTMVRNAWLCELARLSATSKEKRQIVAQLAHGGSRNEHAYFSEHHLNLVHSSFNPSLFSFLIHSNNILPRKSIVDRIASPCSAIFCIAVIDHLQGTEDGSLLEASLRIAGLGSVPFSHRWFGSSSLGVTGSLDNPEKLSPYSSFF